jgi:hypothetical protein
MPLILTGELKLELRSIVEWLPIEPAGAVARGGLAALEGAEVGARPEKSSLMVGIRTPGVDGFAGWFEGEVQVHGVVDGVAFGGVWWGEVFEDVEVEFEEWVSWPWRPENPLGWRRFASLPFSVRRCLGRIWL